MDLSTEPRFVLSTEEYKQARSSRVALHEYLDRAFSLGTEWTGVEVPANRVFAEPPTDTVDASGDTSDLPLIDVMSLRPWDAIKNGSPENPIDKFRLHNLPGDSKTAGIFDSMLLMALKHAASNFRG
jgi:hypothetical protein